MTGRAASSRGAGDEDLAILLNSASVSDFGRTIGEFIMRFTTICEQRPIARETPDITVQKSNSIMPYA
ncbi:MAG: hypothetical protein IPM83_11880 [Ignavibacteria bacterium]|nr:hypothetical protein [Ignavibacteria bacterium]